MNYDRRGLWWEPTSVLTRPYSVYVLTRVAQPGTPLINSVTRNSYLWIEIRPLSVFFADVLYLAGPFDANGRVVPADASFVAGLERAGHVVEQNAVLSRDQEAVGELLGDVEHLEVFGGELNAEPLLVGSRVRAHVDNAIEYRTGDATNGLRFAKWRVLPMKAPKRASFEGLGHIHLGDRWIEASRGEFVLGPRSRKEPAVVDDRFQVDHISTRERRLFEDHQLSVEDRCQCVWLLWGMVNSMSANLMVTDVARSLAFYADGVGGTIAFTVDAEQNSNMDGGVIDGAIFASVRLGDSEMMLQDRANLAEDAPHAFSVDDQPGGTFSLYFRVDDVDAVLAALGDVEVVKPIQQTWYGMREVWVRDPDGYVVTIGTPQGPPPEV